MIWVNGRLSWLLVLTIAYVTLVIVGTDTVWRLVQAPIAVIAGSGLVVMVAGVAAIFLLSARFKKRRSAERAATFIPRMQ